MSQECHNQIVNRFPELSETEHRSTALNINTGMGRNSIFNIVEPNSCFNVGPFSIAPIQAYHGDTPDGCVVYVVKLKSHNTSEKKIVIGWDFLGLPISDQNLIWNPDLLILGTETFNPHPETGMISVSDAFELVNNWNAKECYIVHYSGLLDIQEAKNQWFRGPTKPMTTDELQRVIDSILRIVSSDGRFKMTVAREGMLWTAQTDEITKQDVSDCLEIEGLDKYTLRIENDDKNKVLKLVIEDRTNRYDL